jgi:tripartite-type tricarboxylate transporter receptor subunit TctC
LHCRDRADRRIISWMITATIAQTSKLLKLPDVRERLSGEGMEPVGNSPARFAELVRRENAQRSKVVKSRA